MTDNTGPFSFDICAPDPYRSTNDPLVTCFTKDQLITIIEVYNSDKENSDKIKYRKNMSIPELGQLLQKAMSNRCSSEVCYLKTTPMIEYFKTQDNRVKMNYYERFKPELPTDKGNPNNLRPWLSNTDIRRVMQMIQNISDDFVFLGPLPVDFEEVINQMVFDICEKKNTFQKMYSRGVRRIGIIINLDRFGQSGSHWVTIFIDMSHFNSDPDDPWTIEFFDSTGNPPPKRLEKYMNGAKDKLLQIGGDVEIVINNVTHQKKDTECGVYSLYYIIERLKGRSAQDIFESVVPDDLMYKYRYRFFRVSNEGLPLY